MISGALKAMLETIVVIAFLVAALAVTAAFIRGALDLAHGAVRPHMERGFRRFFPNPLALERAPMNPILGRRPAAWEAAAVMNPAAILADGRVHLFYRAVGTDGVSRIGYAESEDGLHFNRVPYPVYMLREGDDMRDAAQRRAWNPQLFAELYASGGSLAGVEDPRAVTIDGRVYLSFSAFHGWDSLRIGVVSADLHDIERKKWNWTAPTFLSAPNEVHKNWVIFPRKIGGKYAVLHGFKDGTRRRAMIEYLDSLDEDPEKYVKSSAKFRNDPKEFDENVWDSRIRGAGPPPIETPAGWLVLYHANDAKEPQKYKVGALLLDRNDPTKIIARSPRPILEPEMAYENDGKPGIVYACGAVIKDGLLIVYYGGGDNVICAAAAPVGEFLHQLSGYRRPQLPIRVPSLVPVPA
jgi:predicted GH43/DUF377 family glycosyl hydrolase